MPSNAEGQKGRTPDRKDEHLNRNLNPQTLDNSIYQEGTKLRPQRACSGCRESEDEGGRGRERAQERGREWEKEREGKQARVRAEAIDRCRANLAHRRQSKPDSGLGFQIEIPKTLKGVPSSQRTRKRTKGRLHRFVPPGRRVKSNRLFRLL